MNRPDDSAIAASRSGLPLHVDCPRCRSAELDVPEYPRGDDAVECRSCGSWFCFSELEAIALDDTRRVLSRAFPFLPLESGL